MEDFDCIVGKSILSINEKNVHKFPKVTEDKDKFIKRLKEKGKQDSAIIEIRASGLEGIKLIYDAIKKYSPIEF